MFQRIIIFFICLTLFYFLEGCFYYTREVQYTYERWVQKGKKNEIDLFGLYRKPLYIYLPLMSLQYPKFGITIQLYYDSFFVENSNLKIKYIRIYDKDDKIIFESIDNEKLFSIDSFFKDRQQFVGSTSYFIRIKPPFKQKLSFSILFEYIRDGKLYQDSVIKAPMKRTIDEGIGMFLAGTIIRFRK